MDGGMGGWIQKFVAVLAYTGRAWSWRRTQHDHPRCYLPLPLSQSRSLSLSSLPLFDVLLVVKLGLTTRRFVFC